jgi:DNA-binding MarR family transcriptional regulator
MTQEMAFATIRQGNLPAAEAWELLSPLVDTSSAKLAGRICDALRAWTWKALDRRRRDQELREWVDLLNRVEAFFVNRFEALAARIEVLAELLHESLSVAELAAPEDLIRRKHVAPILKALTSEGDWIDRGDLMEALALKPANMTRLMTLLVDMGWAEQEIHGREARYRISAEGTMRARSLPDQRHAVLAEIAATAEKTTLLSHAVMETWTHNLLSLRQHKLHWSGTHNPHDWDNFADNLVMIDIASEVEDDDVLEAVIAPLSAPKVAIAGDRW